MSNNFYYMVNEMRMLQKQYNNGDHSGNLLLQLRLLEALIDDAVHQHLIAEEPEPVYEVKPRRKKH